MASVLSVFISSSLLSVSLSSQNASDMPETITSRDAARFPIIASCTLFGLYLFFKVTQGFLSPPAGASRRECLDERIRHTRVNVGCVFWCRCFLKSTSTCCCLSTSLAWASWLCLTLWGNNTPLKNPFNCVKVDDLHFVLFLFLSPLMSRIFPDSFPNKQYQLLFTQGSGESKEGETCCPTLNKNTVYQVPFHASLLSSNLVLMIAECSLHGRAAW